MIKRDFLVTFLGIFLGIASVIIGIESYFGWFSYPKLWAVYSIVSLLIIWLFIRTDADNKPHSSELLSDIFKEGYFADKLTKIFATPSLKVDIDRLPEPSVALVGRETELALIKDALIDTTKAVVAIIAGGGVGKSALTWAWLQRSQPNYGGAKLVFGWSFYSQGSHQTTNSSVPFFQQALPFFGYQGELPSDEVEKGRHLAERLRQQPSLLILDGIEPLQHSVHIQGGEIADVALKEFLRCIWRYKLGQHQSLVVISTRQPIVEFEQWIEGYVPIDLQVLTDQDGAKLLKNLHVKGSQTELEQASFDMGGHALGLVLLGRLLVARFHGNVTRRNQLPNLLEDAKEGGHALRVLRYYDKNYWYSPNRLKRFYQKSWHWFTGKDTIAERIFLRLIGLFDRPMGLAEKEVLFAKAKYAQPLAQLNNNEWQSLQQRLEQAGLLLKNDRKKERREWDVHPLVRHYFGQTFQKEQPKAYQQAQLVLFEYYQFVPDKHQPDTLEELEPLYRAVVHGCLAGEYQKAYKVFFDTIQRGDEYYTSTKLGTFSQNLTAVSAFFPERWDNPTSNGLSEDNKAHLLGEVSYNLMSLGRLIEAIEPRLVNGRIRNKLKDWENAAVVARNLVNLYLPLGQLQNTEKAAQQAIVYANQTDDYISQVKSYSHLATTQHQIGDLLGALKQFKKAENLQQRECLPDQPWLYEVQGAWYSTLLLDQAIDIVAREAVLERVQYSMKISLKNNWLYKIALNYLVLARTFFSLNRIEKSYIKMDEAVQSMRKSSRFDFMPQTLLTRANFLRHQKDFQAAQYDLDESFDIIERCGMKLYEVDANLLQGNLNLDQNQTADNEYKIAKELIAITGYHLRDPELDLLGARIAFYHQDFETARIYLKKAREKLEEMGYWGLLFAWEEVKKEFDWED